MKIIQLLCLLGFCIILDGCNFEKMRNKKEKIHEVALGQCECDDVRLINYTEENFRTYVELEIVGSDESSKRGIANKINEALKDSIPEYCKIDEFILDFLNKGNHELITIRYCKIDE
jgi:hypothetical protein